MRKKNLLRIIAFVVLFSLILSVIAFAMPPGQLKKLQRNNYNYNAAADYVKLLGIMKGYGNGDLGLEDYVKRGDIVVMIVRAFKLSMIMEKYQVELEDLFPDVDKDSYFAKDILVAKKLGIAKGDGKEFKPHKFVTIEEAILLIERSVKKANSNVKVYDVELRDIYDNDKDAMKEPARRKDIALMLYYVLTGEMYDGDKDEAEKTDLATIEYQISADEILAFSVDKFTNVLKSKTSKTLKYVMFEEIKKEEKYDLYYNYRNKYSETVDDEIRYYASGDGKLISKVSFVSDENVTGTFFIYYKAYVEGASFTGKIKITVNENKVLKNVKVEDDDFEVAFNFKKDILDKVTTKKFEKVIFELPSSRTEGTLYNDYEGSNQFRIRNIKYNISELDELTFMAKDYVTVNINYKVYDVSGNEYTGKIIIDIN